MDRRGKVPVLDGREGCSTRCLPPEAAKAARERIGEDEIRRVPFTCQVSREPATAVLIGEATAGRLLAAGPGLLRTEAEARALASLADATLCACDIATLLGRPQPEAALRALAGRGLAEERAMAGMAGMPYFGLTGDGHALLERVSPGTLAGDAPGGREGS